MGPPTLPLWVPLLLVFLQHTMRTFFLAFALVVLVSLPSPVSSDSSPAGRVARDRADARSLEHDVPRSPKQYRRNPTPDSPLKKRQDGDHPPRPRPSNVFKKRDGDHPRPRPSQVFRRDDGDHRPRPSPVYAKRDGDHPRPRPSQVFRRDDGDHRPRPSPVHAKRDGDHPRPRPSQVFRRDDGDHRRPKPSPVFAKRDDDPWHPKPSGVHHPRRSPVEETSHRRSSRSLEGQDIIGTIGTPTWHPDDQCPAPLMACPVRGAPDADAFECVDLLSDLDSCGGCAADDIVCVFPPFPLVLASSPSLKLSVESIRLAFSFCRDVTNCSFDCTAIPNARGVECVSGFCEVRSCAEGYVVGLSRDTCVRQ